MILSINSSTKAVVLLFAILIGFAGCVKIWEADHSFTGVADESPIARKDYPIAILPVYNLSGTPAPLKDIRESLIKGLKNQGLHTLGEKVLE